MDPDEIAQSADSGLDSGSDESTPDEQEQAPDQSPQPEYAQSQPDMPPSWTGQEQGQGQPQYQQQPQYNIPQQPLNFDPNLLNEAVTSAREEAIRAHFNAQYSAAATELEQRSINAQYQATVQSFRNQVREAHLNAREWQAQQREQHLQQQLLPLVRQYAAQDLARKHNLPLEVVLKDNVTGQDIWDADHMRKQAEWNAKHGYQQRVTARRQSGVDRPLNAGGGGSGGGDLETMSSDDFAKYRERVRASGGRALNAG